MKKKKASLDEIANLCKVSKTLVSMVLNGHGEAYGIKKETQERVFDAAEKLNYKSKQFTSGIRSGKSHTIGLIVSDISNPFYARVARGVEDYASKAGYNLIICSTDENMEKETAVLRMLKERRVAGLLISTTFSSTRHINSMLKENFPFVLIDRFFPHTETNYVIVNNYQGAYDATEHLIGLGYRRIAHITVPPSHVTSLRYRKNGYYDALKKHKLRLNKRFYVQLPHDDLKDNLKREIRTLLASPNNVQAIFLANNEVTVAFLECVNEMRLRIPHEIAVVSFDDIELFRVYYPPITAVEQPIDDICRVSVNTLINEITEGPAKEKVKIKLDAKLIIRESCGNLYRRK